MLRIHRFLGVFGLGHVGALKQVWGHLPPELSDPLRSSLNEAWDVLNVLNKVNFKQFEDLLAEQAVGAMEFGVAQEVLGALGDIFGVLTKLASCVDGTTSRGEEDNDLSKPSGEGEDFDCVTAVDGVVNPVRDRFCEELDFYVEWAVNDDFLRWSNASMAGGMPSLQELNYSDFILDLQNELTGVRERLKAMVSARSKWGLPKENKLGGRQRSL